MNFPLHLSKAVIEYTEIKPKHRKASDIANDILQ